MTPHPHHVTAEAVDMAGWLLGGGDSWRTAALEGGPWEEPSSMWPVFLETVSSSLPFLADHPQPPSLNGFLTT